MPDKCAANLLTHGPVVMVQFEVRPAGDYFELHVHHRHWATSLFECTADVFQSLTLEEVVDCIDATLETTLRIAINETGYPV